jgi:hypothetical protein
MRFSFSILLGADLLLAAGCGLGSGERTFPPPENVPPEIHEIRVSPSRLHRSEQATLTGVVEDVDRDFLIYRWSARHGSFPLDQVRFSVPYRAPDAGVADTVSLLVADAQDTTTLDRVIRLANLAGAGDLNVVAEANRVGVTWAASVDEGLYDFRGYHVYSADRSFSTIPAEELAGYQRTSEPQRTRLFFVSGLLQGTIYFFQVRAVRGTGEMSAFAGEKDAAPRPQGLGQQMSEIGYPERTPQAFDFSRGVQISFDPANPSDVPSIDFYLGTTAADDGEGPLALKSPDLLAPRNPVWETRTVEFKVIGGDWSIGETDTTGFSREAPVGLDTVVAVRLPEGRYAKVQVTSILNSYPYRQIQYRWAYQPIPDYPKF